MFEKIEETGIFLSSLKLGNITPIFKKDDPLDKSNYRPVSILPLLSKVYERIIYNQLSQHSEHSWFDIYIGVPQGSILGTLLFNIFINNLFLNVIKSEVCNFADDNTLCSFDKKLDTIFSNLKYDLENVLSWFQGNSLKANPSKFQFMILGDKQNTSLVLNINGKKINNSREIELLGIVIDNQLKFKKHIENLCKKASFKLHALCRIRKFLTVEKARVLANAFINSQFNYAPLIWMFASKTAINKILKIHYRTHQVVYREYHKSYEELLQINKDISIHQKHLSILALEVYKSNMLFNPEFMWHCFNTNPIPYNLRKGSRLLIPSAKSKNFGTNSIKSRGSLLWNNLPLRLKNSQTTDDFKFEQKNLGKIHCTCTVCR